ncbi:MAG: 1-deoxy-D-xylulose-5-phosphate reductoisomerase [Gammaproteobacteria bacterium]|nr:1-deoxy-D-xylulose-5-phosphate reductoisomerase [Gammaproteobacteria bacterium]
MIGVTVLGATGSIGGSTLDVLARHKDQYHVVALTAHRNVKSMLKLCNDFQPEYAVMALPDEAEKLEVHLKKCRGETKVLAGVEGLEYVSSLDQTDCVVAGIVGAAGLLPALAAARSGKRILLANKEALVMSGRLFMNEVKKYSAELLPIDSEHNAIFQCLPSDFSDGLNANGVRRILLTASGGPFRKTSLDKLKNVTPAQACAHPNWSMGRKISVDSATMMNKGLEVIEACWLFDAEPEQIQVVVHPQSVIHSMVEYLDGSVLAQLGSPDMRTPIAHALSWPKRIDAGVQPLNLFDIATLDFESPDFVRFPCLKLAFDTAKRGGTSSTILNAANEVAVQAFLDEQLSFIGIAKVNQTVLDELSYHEASTLDVILSDDKIARELANDVIKKLSH